MADNPRRAWLQSLLTSMDTTLATMRSVLDKPASDVGSGKVWTGTAAADTFESDLTGRSRTIHTVTDGLRTTVENALRAEPLQVTQDQARQMQLDHQHDW
jgi:capsid protein